MLIAIIDYGAGNLRSVQKAFEYLGLKAEVTRSATIIETASGIVLPGVGSFDAAISDLQEFGLDKTIKQIIADGKPFLGICLGLQHLFDSSEEGKLPGLGILSGKVKKFNFKSSQSLAIPHMGWNQLSIKEDNPLLDGIKNGAMVYFAHSYYVEPQNPALVATTTDYGVEFTSAVCQNKLFGIQFHPEKSGATGLKILENFGKLCEKERGKNGF